MTALDLGRLSKNYRAIRKAVYEEATKPLIGAADRHRANQLQLRRGVTEICDNANLERYRHDSPGVASAIWHHLWTKNRYAGIRASLASREIRDIEFAFNDFPRFSSPSWDIEGKGDKLVRAGDDAQHFLCGTGPFKGRLTVGKVPRLVKVVSVARKFKSFLDRKAPGVPASLFITDGHGEDDVWAIHGHLLKLGYGADLTALHFMMDMGFEVIKPDIVITRLFLAWGWLHLVVPRLPPDLSADDLKGKGKYGSRFKYMKPILYRPVIDLARAIVKATSRDDLIADIGWATDNPLREFDIFVVKYGQEPEEDFGVVRTLYQKGVRNSCAARTHQ
jgi:hypothetical protein